MSSQLQLAAQLARLSRDEIEAVARDHGVTQASVRDALDFAGALLKPEVIRRSLRVAPRATLTALAGGSASLEPTPATLALALFTDAGSLEQLIPEVTSELDALLADADMSRDALVNSGPRLTESAAEAEHPLEAESRARTSTEQAFETTRIAQLVLRSLSAEPGAVRASGAPIVATSKRLAADAAVDVEQVPQFIDLLMGAALVRIRDGALMVTELAADFASWTRVERYVKTVSAWLQNAEPFLSPLLHDALKYGVTLVDAAESLFPLAPEEFTEQIAHLQVDAQTFGLVADRQVTPLGAHLVRGELTAASALLETEFPSSVRHVYVQPDLSVIAPGPLEPAIEEQLLAFAILESAGLASSYRVSSRSVEAALTAGVTEAEIRAFLGEHSLTGIPQPLDYLLSETSKRHGSIAVSRDPEGAGSLISTTDPLLASQLLVDRSVSILSLSARDETTLRTAFDIDQVMRVLRESGYPATSLQTSRQSVTRERSDENSSPYRALADRVFAAAQNEGDGASIERMLELAVRQKQRVIVSMSQPDGSEREFTIRPVGLSNGRLRGIDEQAEVERTFPISLLSSAHPVADGSHSEIRSA